MESIVGTFHIDWKIMLAQVFNFGVVFGVLYFFALKPMMKIMRERTEKIEKGLKDAKENAELVANSRVQYEEAMSKAKNEAEKIFQEGKKETENMRLALLEKTKKDAENILNAGKKSLEEEKAKIMQETKSEILSVALKVAEKIMSQKIDGSFDEKSIKEFEKIV